MRTAYAEPVRRVHDELSPLGRSLLRPLAAARAWAQEHWDELLDARDARRRPATRDPASRRVSASRRDRWPGSAPGMPLLRPRW